MAVNLNKTQALHAFWNSFGWPAYDETTVPDNAELPYITYPVEVGEWGYPCLIRASLWYRGTLWKEITDKAEEITGGLNGKGIPYDNGTILLFNSDPKYQRIQESDDSIRRIVMNIYMEFLEI